MSANDIVERSQNWYLSKSFIPHIQSLSFARMAGQSFSLIGQTVNRLAMSIFKMGIVNSPAAYVDKSGNFIGLPLFYFDPAFYEKRFGDDVQDLEHLALMTVNGSVVHEALHIKYSLSRLDEIAKATEYSTEVFNKYGNSMSQVCNIIEDLFIEAQAPEDFVQFIDSKNEVLFSENELEKVAAEFVEAPNLMNAMRLAVMFKRSDIRDRGEFELLPEDAYRAIVVATSLPKGCETARRSDLAAQFCECFEPPDGSTEIEVPGPGEDSEDGEEATSELAKAASSASTVKPATMKKFIEAFERKAAEERRAAEIEGYTEVTDEYGRTALIPSLISLDVSDLRVRPSELPDLRPDNSWVQALRAIRTENHVPGQPRTSGSKMITTRLYRMATDQKIMAYHDSMGRQLGRVEVIILVDLSGSMSWEREIDGIEAEFSRLVLAQAHSTFNALRAAGIACSVYGHTSRGREIPMLVHIASHDMTGHNSSQIDQRFQKAASIEKYENYDGLAINAVSKKFTTKVGAKFMIVLSDGAPAGVNYSGNAAFSHTKEAINGVRKMGITVIALSLVDGVVDSNDTIYGKEWNVNASENLRAEFQKVITRISSK